MRKQIAIVVILFLPLFAGVAISAHAAPSSYAAMFVFGDSLADIGNDLILTRRLKLDPAIPPSVSPHKTYFNGRFSNGYVAAEWLWYRLSGNAPGSQKALKPALAVTQLGAGQSIDFAFGGSRTGFASRTPGGFVVPGLRGQVALFTALHPSNNAARAGLYLIMTGSNDYLPPADLSQVQVSTVVGNISAAVHQLYGAGGRNFLVLGLPDLGTLPLVSALDPEGNLAAALTDVSKKHNDALQVAVTTLRAQLSGAKIVLVNLAEAAESVKDLFLPPGTPPLVATGSPAAAGCLFSLAGPSSCPDVPFVMPDVISSPPSYFYWDAEHPSAFTHKVLGNLLYELRP
jgi:phospholipase/lecithinase/hemolysin